VTCAAVGVLSDVHRWPISSSVFLAAQESSYITADVIAVTGGSPIV
jgi:hypothetical protein